MLRQLVHQHSELIVSWKVKSAMYCRHFGVVSVAIGPSHQVKATLCPLDDCDICNRIDQNIVLHWALKADHWRISIDGLQYDCFIKHCSLRMIGVLDWYRTLLKNQECNLVPRQQVARLCEQQTRLFPPLIAIVVAYYGKFGARGPENWQSIHHHPPFLDQQSESKERERDQIIVVKRRFRNNFTMTVGEFQRTQGC